MKVKTAYRPKTIPAENKPAAEAVIAAPAEGPAVAVEVRPDSAETQSEAERKYTEEVTKADEAAEALRRQIEALRHSEALQRQAAAHAARLQRPSLTREGKLDLWRQQGMPSDQLAFLEANPALVDFSELAAFAANEAAQAGHERGSAEHMQATKQLFDQHMERLKQQAAANTSEPAMNPTPKFFAPPTPPKPRTPPSIVSAPVSREVPTGGPRPEYQQDPTKVNLSVAEKEIAAAAGITLTEYARQKIRLEREKREGIRQ